MTSLHPKFIIFGCLPLGIWNIFKFKIHIFNERIILSLPFNRWSKRGILQWRCAPKRLKRLLSIVHYLPHYTPHTNLHTSNITEKLLKQSQPHLTGRIIERSYWLSMRLPASLPAHGSLHWNMCDSRRWHANRLLGLLRVVLLKC